MATHPKGGFEPPTFKVKVHAKAEEQTFHTLASV